MSKKEVRKMCHEFQAKARARKREIRSKIDKSHKLTKWHTDIRAPAGTPRFYGVRHCKYCELEEIEHAAGHIIDPGLFKKCLGKI